ncbi:hypothetical protein L3X07_04435 [Levilactobacillus brevis]|nr:hypothetical protein [Levilactobacillus brevis]
MVQQTYTFANATPNPTAWLAELPQPYQLDSDQLMATSFYQQRLRPFFQSQLRQLQADLTSAQALANQAGLDKQAAHVTAVLENIARSNNWLLETVGTPYERLSKTLRGGGCQRSVRLMKTIPSIMN